MSISNIPALWEASSINNISCLLHISPILEISITSPVKFEQWVHTIAFVLALIAFSTSV